MKTLFMLLILFVLSPPSYNAPTLGRIPHDGTLRRIRVPILMYHYVSPLTSDADDIRINLTVEPHVFRAQMQYLKDTGYTTVSFYEVDAALRAGAPLPDKPIVLTFDDGYIDHYTFVFSTLKELQFTATFFIITGFADQNASAYLTWQQIGEMSVAGMTMESHTKTHRDLRNRDREFLIYEVLGSTESLRAYTGYPSYILAYPGGNYDNAALDLLQQAQIWRAVTTEQSSLQTTSNQLQMPRLRVSGGMSVAGLEAMLKEER